MSNQPDQTSQHEMFNVFAPHYGDGLLTETQGDVVVRCTTHPKDILRFMLCQFGDTPAAHYFILN